jgi:hypothetical protein
VNFNWDVTGKSNSFELFYRRQQFLDITKWKGGQTLWGRGSILFLLGLLKYLLPWFLFFSHNMACENIFC